MLSEVASIWPWGSTNLADWSGIIGTVEGAGAFGAGYVLYRRHNCHVDGCWRVGRHAAAGGKYIVCRRHHPEPAPTHAHVLQEHERHVARQGEPRN